MAPLNVIIPIAGQGRRFAEAGWSEPKPLIPVAGRPMLQWAMRCLPMGTRLFCVAQEDTAGLIRSASMWTQAPTLLTVAGPTQGAACTVLAAVVGLPPDEPVAVMNADQYFTMDTPLEQVEAQAIRDGWDGFILTFEAEHPKWSYVEVDFRGIVSRVVEKQVMEGHQATVGFYWFRHARELLWAICDLIARNDRTLGEFYLAPAINGLIRTGARFQAVPVKEMHGLGTPEDVAAFEAGRAA